MAWASALEYQLDLLKMEVDTVNSSIRQMDEITKSVKQWTIGLWTGAVGSALLKPNLARYIWLTAAIPLLFWLVDTWHRRIQRKFIWRTIEIGTFLNDTATLQSVFDQGMFPKSFRLLDPKARNAQNDAKYKRFVAWHRVMLFRSLALLYVGLIVISLALGVGYVTGVLEVV